jgi:C-terminal processing protease CtpA/Prc
MRCLRWLCLFAICLPCYAQPSDGHIGCEEEICARLHQVDSLWSLSRFGEAVPILGELMQHECGMDQHSVEILYQLARGHALIGQTDTAIGILRRLADLGKLKYTDMAHDPDLDHLRSDPRFMQLLEETERHQIPWQRLFGSLDTFRVYTPNLSCELKTVGLSILWSEVKYNFAYFDRLSGLDWDSLYVASLPAVCATASTFEYYQLLRRIGALLHDGHTAVLIPNELVDTLQYFPAIRTRLFGDTVIVTDVYDPMLLEQGILPGAEIVKIDGLPVHDYAALHIIPYQNASTQQDLMARTYEHFLLAGACNSTMTLGLANADQTVAIKRVDRDWSLEELNTMQRNAEYSLIGANIGYLILSTFHDEELTSIVARNLATIKRSDALIIDLRENYGGHTTVALNTLGLFMERPFQTHRWETPRYTPYHRAEGGMLEWESESARVMPGAGADAYRKPIVLLSSGRTYSAAEHFLIAFRNAKRGAIIGERSGGSTGHILEVPLPGGGAITICTTRDYLPDGNPFNGVGVVPDVMVKPVVDDIRSGRDVVLKTAIEYLNRLLGRDPAAIDSVSRGHTVFSIEIDSTGESNPRLPGSR